MTKEEIIENSKIMAEYLGWKYQPFEKDAPRPAGWYKPIQFKKGEVITDDQFWEKVCRNHKQLRFYDSFDKIPGFSDNGGHLKPSKEQMYDYWERGLKQKVDNAKSILVLGSVAKDFLKDRNINKPTAFVIHPSKRNTWLYNKNKDSILQKIKNLL